MSSYVYLYYLSLSNAEVSALEVINNKYLDDFHHAKSLVLMRWVGPVCAVFCSR